MNPNLHIMTLQLPYQLASIFSIHLSKYRFIDLLFHLPHFGNILFYLPQHSLLQIFFPPNIQLRLSFIIFHLYSFGQDKLEKEEIKHDNRMEEEKGDHVHEVEQAKLCSFEKFLLYSQGFTFFLLSFSSSPVLRIQLLHPFMFTQVVLILCFLVRGFGLYPLPNVSSSTYSINQNGQTHMLYLYR